MNFVFTLLFVVWWIRNLEVLLVLWFVELHEAKLGEAMLKTDTIKTNTPYLNTNGTLAWPTRVQLLEPRTLHLKLFLRLPQEVVALTCLLLVQLGNLEGSQNRRNGESEGIQAYKLTVMTVELERRAYSTLSHVLILLLTVFMHVSLAFETLFEHVF